MSDFIWGYKHVGGLSDALQLAGHHPVASDGYLPCAVIDPSDRIAAGSSSRPELTPSLPSSPAPEPDRAVLSVTGPWRILWIERSEHQFESESVAAELYEAEERTGEAVSRPGLTVSNYLQRLDGAVWKTVRKAERPEFMISQ